MKKIYNRLYTSYVTEVMTVFIITLFLNISNLKPPGILLFVLSTTVIFFFGAYILKKYSNVWLFFLAIFIFGILNFCNYYILAAILVSVYLPYRLYNIYINRTKNFVHESLLISLLFIVFLQFTNSYSAYYVLFHILFIIQMLLFIILNITKDQDPKSLNYIDVFKTTMIVSVMLMVVTTLSFFSLKIMIYLVKLLYYLLVTSIVYVLKPLFNQLETVELDSPTFDVEESEGETTEDITANLEDKEGILTNIPVEFLFYGLAFVILVILYIFFKRNKNITVTEEGNTIASSEINSNNRQKKERIKRNTPTNKARAAYYNFETWLLKNNAGRYNDETLEEWLVRTHLDDIITPGTIEKYQQLRYNDIELTNEELKEFKQSIKVMKQQIKYYK